MKTLLAPVALVATAALTALTTISALAVPIAAPAARPAE